MITDADIEKLLAVRPVRATMLSLYLGLSSHPPALRGLPARADELISEAARADGYGTPPVPGARELREDRGVVRRMLEVHARDWPGRTMAVFAGGDLCPAEAVVLPCLVADRAVFAARPHVRPLLLALQRCPGYYLAVVDQMETWVFRVTGNRIDRLAVPAGVGAPRAAGWYGLEAHRIGERVTALACHRCADGAAALGRLMTGGAPQPLVIGGDQEGIEHFLAALPGGPGGQVISSFAADPRAVPLARMVDLAGQAVRSWTAEREERLVAGAGQGGNALSATGLQACLAAVNVGAAGLLIVPDDGLIPGFSCQRCGELSQASADCPGCGAASIAVPDLIEELAVRARHDGAQVATVREPPGGITAQLRFPLVSRACPAASTREAIDPVRA
jgi:hypothetical protein